MEKNVTIILILAIVLLISLPTGIEGGYEAGYQAGIQHQKDQPLQINIDTYRDNGTTHYSNVFEVTNEGFVNLWPEYVENFTFYKITKYQGI